jgi:predicted RND superfamily exporter protein
MPSIESIVDKFSRKSLERRWMPLGFVALLVLLAIAGIVVRGVQADFSPQALFATFEDQAAVDAAFTKSFGKTDNVIAIVMESDDVLSDDNLRWLHSASLALEDKSWCEKVESVTRTPIPRRAGNEADGFEVRVDNPVVGPTVEREEAEALRATIRESKLFDRRLVSVGDSAGKRDVAMLAFYIDRERTQVKANRPINQAFNDYLAAHPAPAGATVKVSGLPHIRVWVVDQFFHDQTRIVPLAMLFCIFCLFLTFRWWAAVLFPAMAVGISVLILVGTMAWAQEPFNIINQILPVLLIVVGVNDSIHVVSRYMEERATTQTNLVAGHRTMMAVVVACGLTAMTSSVGFASNIFSHTELLRNFSIAAAAGALLTYIITVLFLPPTLTLVAPPSPKSQESRKDGITERAVVWLMGMSYRNPRKVLLGTVLLMTPAIYLSGSIVVDTRLRETFRPGDEVLQTIELMEKKLNGSVPFELHFTSTEKGQFDDPDLLNAIAGLEGWIEAQEGAISATSYQDYLHETWVAYSGDPSKREQPFKSRQQVAQLASLLEGGTINPLDAFVNLSRTEMRVAIAVEDVGSKRSNELSDQLTAEVAQRLAKWPAVTLHLTGDAYSASRGLTSLISDLTNSLFFSTVLIFGFMTLLFRSLRMGLISAPPNMLPLIWTLAYMALQGINLNTTSVIIFSIAVGLAVDDTIHVLARLLEEARQGHSKEECVMRTARGTGRAILSASLMLVGGMAVLFASSFVPVRLFGELMTVTLSGCILGDLILLPALLALFWTPDPKHKTSSLLAE